MLNGWIILDKPLGLGSTQGVGAVKRALREGGYAKVKIGHGGTLDPLATGVLPIALGEATKLAGRMLDSDKSYDFTIAFGAETDGLDAEGVVVATSDHRPTIADIDAVLPRFTGPIDQVPPAYSAIKVDGRRAYDLARAGEAVEVTVQGADLEDPKGLMFSIPGAMVQATGGTTFRVQFPAGMPPALGDVRFSGRFGVSNPRPRPRLTSFARAADRLQTAKASDRRSGLQSCSDRESACWACQARTRSCRRTTRVSSRYPWSPACHGWPVRS